MVRSHLEYASITYGPCSQADTATLDRIQRKFLRFLNFKLKISFPLIDYHSLQISFNLTDLSLRRNYFDLIFFNKLLHGYIESPQLLPSISFHASHHNRRNPQLFDVPYCKNNFPKFSPIIRMMRSASTLCYSVNIIQIEFNVLKKFLINFYYNYIF
ncbi:hypothetical protein O3M35_000568 [Rhynocoris fuscipes]|uniref:Maturase K n=1 Tax=Rhynocoris fuscipes TaxID=488301 RepID=A0AAW1DP66_9HEMI